MGVLVLRQNPVLSVISFFILFLQGDSGGTKGSAPQGYMPGRVTMFIGPGRLILQFHEQDWGEERCGSGLHCTAPNHANVNDVSAMAHHAVVICLRGLMAPASDQSRMASLSLTQGRAQSWLRPTSLLDRSQMLPSLR